MKIRLLFAAIDIGYRIENYSKFLLEKFPRQISLQSFVKHQVSNKHYAAKYDYVIDYYKTNRVVRSFAYLLFFLYSLLRYNTFYFLSGETLLSRELRRFELSVYKLLGKRVIFNFVGSDIRSEEYLKWKAKHIFEYLDGAPTPPKSEPFQMELIADAIKFADAILVSTPDMLELVPQAKYFPVVYVVDDLAAEIDHSAVLNKQPNKIYILHSPSNFALKGTEIITAVLEQLQQEFPDEIELVLPHRHKNYDMPHTVSRYELFQLMNQADIVIDQLIIGWYGSQSIEALLAGKQVVCYIENEFQQYLFENCPIVNANAANLKENLIDCISNIKRGAVADKAALRNWVKTNHSLANNHKLLVEAIFPASKLN